MGRASVNKRTCDVIGKTRMWVGPEVETADKNENSRLFGMNILTRQ